jgi:RNA polymerase sigma-70 factor (ECF subfamily)
MPTTIVPGPVPPLTGDSQQSLRRRRRGDRRAVEALRARRPEAMALVMEAHGRAILGFLIGVLSDRATAEDVLQQVLLEVWQRAASYDPDRAGLLTWVLMIARSRALDELRRRVPEPVDPATVAERAPADGRSDSDPERLLEQWRIAGLLERLPQEEAQLLRMRFYDGLSQSEISEQTGIAIGTTKTRMVNGRCQLRNLLESEERAGVVK